MNLRLNRIPSKLERYFTRLLDCWAQNLYFIQEIIFRKFGSITWNLRLSSCNRWRIGRTIWIWHWREGRKVLSMMVLCRSDRMWGIVKTLMRMQWNWKISLAVLVSSIMRYSYHWVHHQHWIEEVLGSQILTNDRWSPPQIWWWDPLGVEGQGSRWSVSITGIIITWQRRQIV